MPTVQVEDGTLWYEETGTGPPLVCLHGAWQDHRSWDTQVERFADEYRVITVDFRGHGSTGPTMSQSYSVEMFVDDLEAVMSSLGVERPILIGNSMGGMVIQSYLDRHPAAARGAVIGGPLRTMPPVEMPTVTKQLFSPIPFLTGMLETVGTRATYGSLLDSTRLVNGGPWLTLDDRVRNAAMQAVATTSTSEFRKTFRALYEFESPTLSHVSTPVFVVYGDHETALIKRQGDRLAKTVRSGTVLEVDDSGHLVNQDRPEEFNDSIASFFAGLPSATVPGNV